LQLVEGARKAAETRKRKKATEHAEEHPILTTQTHDDDDEPCIICEMTDPPFGDSEDVVWISCDGCCAWCHISCANLEQIPATWLCFNCKEIW
jgi:hypothetical protein